MMMMMMIIIIILIISVYKLGDVGISSNLIGSLANGLLSGGG